MILLCQFIFFIFRSAARSHPNNDSPFLKSFFNLGIDSVIGDEYVALFKLTDLNEISLSDLG